MKCDKRFTKDSDMEVFLLNAENASVWERKKEWGQILSESIAGNTKK